MGQAVPCPLARALAVLLRPRGCHKIHGNQVETLAAAKRLAIVATACIATLPAHRMSASRQGKDHARLGACSVHDKSIVDERESQFNNLFLCPVDNRNTFWNRYWKPENYSEHPYECCNK